MAESKSRRRREWKRLLRLWRLGPASGTAGAMSYITDYPDAFAAWLIYADCKWSTARYDKARWALRRAQRRARTHERRRICIDWGMLYEQKNDLKRAEIWFRRAVRAIPSTNRYVCLGAVLAKQGRLTESENVLRRAIRARTAGDAIDQAYFNLGLVQRARGRHEEAARLFEAALRIDPRYTLAKDALRDVRTALASPVLSASPERAYKQLCRLWDRGGPATVAAAATKYTDAYPDSCRGWLMLARSQWSMHRYDAARRSLRRAQRVIPRRCRQVLFEWWGLFFRHKHDLGRAESWFRRAVRAQPTTGHFIFLGATLAKQGKLAEAEKMHRRAIAARTRGEAVDEAHLNLGVVLRALLRNREAARHFRAALRIDPRYTEARAALRDVLRARIEHAALRRKFEARERKEG